MEIKNIVLLSIISLSFLLAIFYNRIKSLKKRIDDDYINSKEELEALINSTRFAEYVDEREINEIELESLFSGEECLMPKNKAIKELKDSYGISNSNPDNNLRFILGKCNPVLLIPGIYATKFVVELECKNIATEERTTTLKNLRLYCGKSLCSDESKDREEHPLFMSALDPAFTIIGNINDKYSSCLAFMMNFFQNPEECPTVNNKNLCFYSKYIRVGYYGSTPNTLANSKCGVEAVKDVIQTGSLLIDNIINFGPARSFHEMEKALKNRGYSYGFSLGALPNDYRTYLYPNNFATKVFESQINSLYENTGKPVVIVAHSYGNNLALTNLLKNKANSAFLKKIKKFVAIAPPFAGATKLLDAFFNGINEFNKEVDFLGKKIKISNYNIFGQQIMYKALPVIMELRPLSIAAKIFTDSKYKELGEAIKSRIDTERECKSTDCSSNTLKSKTEKFDNIFKGYFPSLTDSECEYESSISGNANTYNRKCYTNIYNIGECPTVVTKSVKPTQKGLDNDAYCGKTGENYYYQGDCIDGRNCLDQMYYADNKCPNVFKNTEAVNYLIKRFNDNFSSEFGRLDSSYFDSYEQIKSGVQASINRQDESSIIKDLPLPPVDTDIIYASHAPTTHMVVVNDEDFSVGGSVLYRGGDDTVPAWSPLLTGLKWIYEMKKDTTYKNKVRLIQYCSRIASSGQYKYDPNKEQTFAALGCSCIKNNVYESKLDDCFHVEMLGDSVLIDYVNSIIDDPKETAEYSSSKKAAISSYNSSINYETVCNKELKNIFETTK